MAQQQAKFERLESGATRWTDGRGELIMRAPHPDVLVCTWSGYLSEAMHDVYVRFCSPAMTRDGKPDLFGDYSRAEGYDTQLRVKQTEFVRGSRDQLGEIHILLGSRILAMGLTVANMALGNAMKVFSSRTLFDAAIHGAVAARKARPVSAAR